MDKFTTVTIHSGKKYDSYSMARNLDHCLPVYDIVFCWKVVQICSGLVYALNIFLYFYCIDMHGNHR